MKSVKVDVFSSPCCNRCSRVFELLDGITNEPGAERVEWRAVNVVEELDYAVKLGVLSLPAIAIDGELIFKNRPPANKLRNALNERLQILQRK